ncbi:hypothetical protein WJX72_003102 [[Myrmecia] bisecta]|uniref:ELYS-like domain-containing protein n=1 Tax=[Myrmecia] bisecta TaxID=41462 RepID=A0AAW1R6E3_9CHLO
MYTGDSSIGHLLPTRAIPLFSGARFSTPPFTPQSISLFNHSCLIQNTSLPVDHANGSGGTFTLYSIVCDELWRKPANGTPAGPIFLWSGSRRSSLQHLGAARSLFEYAAEHEALVVFTDRRYFGWSLPDEYFQDRTINYLTYEQTVQDDTQLVQLVRKQYGAQASPAVIFSVGSKVGVLARLLQPGVFAGVVASGAALLGYPGQVPAIDSEAPYQVITQAAKDANPNCPANIHTALAALAAAANGTTAAASSDGFNATAQVAVLQQLKTSCHGAVVIGSNEVDSLVAWVEAVIEHLAEEEGRVPLNSQIVHNLTYVCNTYFGAANQTAAAALRGLADAFNFTFTSLPCSNIDFGNGMLPELDETTDYNAVDLTSVASSYLDCSGEGLNMHYHKSSGVNDVFFAHDEAGIPTFEQACLKRFPGVSIDEAWGARMLGPNITQMLLNSSNILFINGKYDANRAASVTWNVSSSVLALDVPMGAGADMYDLASERPVLRAVRDFANAQIKRWVAGAQPALSTAPSPAPASGKALAAAGRRLHHMQGHGAIHPQPNTVSMANRKLFDDAESAAAVSLAPGVDYERLFTGRGLLGSSEECAGCGCSETTQSLPLDYVQEVCSDKFFASSDPEEAYLLDGNCVKQWCNHALQRSADRLRLCLSQNLNQGPSAGLSGQAGSIGALVETLEALAQPDDTAMTEHARPAADSDLVKAKRLQQCLQVLQWVRQQGLATDRKSGRYPSEQQWRSTLNKRRDASQPIDLFLHDMLQALKTQHDAMGFQYPPASVEKAIAGLFLEGSTHPAAWHAKLAMFLYLLLDTGLISSTEGFRQAFSLTASQVAQWQAQYLLDDAALGPAAEASLEAACQLLPGFASPAMPFKFVEALAARGRPDRALAVLRARGRVSSPPSNPKHLPSTAASGGAQSLHEALTGLQTRLACGLLTEAFMELRAYTAELRAGVRAHHASVLIRQLADWALENHALNDITQLPLSDLEEQVLCQWLQQKAGEGSPAGDHLPLYYLQRGRIAEALHAHAQLVQQPRPSQGPQDDLQRDQLQQILTAAARLLPDPQRALTIHPAKPGTPLLQMQSARTSGGQTAAVTTASSGVHNGVSVLAGLPNQGIALRPSGFPALHVRPSGDQPAPLLSSNLGRSIGGSGNAASAGALQPVAAERGQQAAVQSAQHEQQGQAVQAQQRQRAEAEPTEGGRQPASSQPPASLLMTGPPSGAETRSTAGQGFASWKGRSAEADSLFGQTPGRPDAAGRPQGLFTPAGGGSRKLGGASGRAVPSSMLKEGDNLMPESEFAAMIGLEQPSSRAKPAPKRPRIGASMR